MERAFATLSVGVLIVWALSVIISGGNFSGIFQLGTLLFMILPSLFPTICIFVWLLIDRRPTAYKLAGIVGAAAVISCLGIWWVYLGTGDGIGRTYVPLISIPVAGGIIFGCLAYFTGAKLPKN